MLPVLVYFITKPTLYDMRYLITCLGLLLMGFSCTKPTTLTQEKRALAKIKSLEGLMEEARSHSIDVGREETVLWFSREFLKFANWDEAHQPEIEKLYGYYEPFKDEKEAHAAALPDFERQEVIAMLDKGIAQLQQVLEGKVQRRPVRKVDWENVALGDDQLLNKGKPVFLHDYFSN